MTTHFKTRPNCMGPLSALVLCLLLSLPKNVAAQPPGAVPSNPGDHEFQIEHDGRTRYYIVHVPKDYLSSESLPLVIVLHGGGGNAKNVMRMTGMSAKADAAGFLAVYPYGTGLFRKHVLTWNAANCCGYARKKDIDDVGFMKVMLTQIERDFRVDSKRIFVTGISNGGMLAFRLACELSDRIAAIAPVAAAFNDEICKPANPVSVIMFHGTLDQNVPFHGGTGLEAKEKRVDRSVADAVLFWSGFNKCDPVSNRGAWHKGRILREEFSKGRDETAVVLYTIKGGGHAWPGGKAGYIFADTPTDKISATDLIWDFFQQHPKP